MAVEINNSTCLNGLDVGIGENVILDFPTKTLLNSLCRTNLTFRKQVEKQENIRLVFIKKNKQRIKLVSIERMECTEEQNLFARNVYSGKWDSLEFEINNRGE